MLARTSLRKRSTSPSATPKARASSASISGRTGASTAETDDLEGHRLTRQLSRLITLREGQVQGAGLAGDHTDQPLLESRDQAPGAQLDGADPWPMAPATSSPSTVPVKEAITRSPLSAGRSTGPRSCAARAGDPAWPRGRRPDLGARAANHRVGDGAQVEGRQDIEGRGVPVLAVVVDGRHDAGRTRRAQILLGHGLSEARLDQITEGLAAHLSRRSAGAGP